MDLFIFFLQGDISFDLWGELLKFGGIVSVLLVFAVIALWRDNKDKVAALSVLNESIKKDAKENMRVMTAMEGLLERVLDAQAKGEERIISSFRGEFQNIKKMVHERIVAKRKDT